MYSEVILYCSISTMYFYNIVQWKIQIQIKAEMWLFKLCIIVIELTYRLLQDIMIDRILLCILK